MEIRRLTKIDPASADTLSLDLLLVTPTIADVWAERVRVPWLGGTVSVVSRRGLVQLKTMRGSGQDQDDIRKLEELDGEA